MIKEKFSEKVNISSTLFRYAENQQSDISGNLIITFRNVFLAFFLFLSARAVALEIPQNHGEVHLYANNYSKILIEREKDKAIISVFLNGQRLSKSEFVYINLNLPEKTLGGGKSINHKSLVNNFKKCVILVMEDKKKKKFLSISLHQGFRHSNVYVYQINLRGVPIRPRPVLPPPNPPVLSKTMIDVLKSRNPLLS
jgi:hypothetical protein